MGEGRMSSWVTQSLPILVLGPPVPLSVRQACCCVCSNFCHPSAGLTASLQELNLDLLGLNPSFVAHWLCA